MSNVTTPSLNEKQYPKKLTALVSFLLLLGCATAPRIDIPQTARFGIINLVEDKMTHANVGLVIFQNFDKLHEIDWDIAGSINSEIIAQLKVLKHDVTVIQPTPKIIERKNSLVTLWSGSKGSVKKDLISEFQELGEKYDIDVLLVIKTYRREDGHSHFFGGYGLFTRLSYQYAYANIEILAIWTPTSAFTGRSVHSLFMQRLSTDMMLTIGEDGHINPPAELNKLEPIIKYDIPDFVKRTMIAIGLVNEKRRYFFKCEHLGEMPQDCDFDEPNRMIEIYGQKLNLAASNDNKTIVIMPTYEVRKKLNKTVYPEVVNLYSNETNKAFKVFIEKLEEENINILDVIKIYSRNGSLLGYVIKTDNYDTYNVLVKFTI